MKRKLNPQKIASLVASAANGVDNIQEGAVGSNGYGFLFIDKEVLLKVLPNGIKYCGGGRIYPLGSMKDFAIDLETHEKVDLNYYFSDEEGHHQDIELISRLKTVAPDMRFTDPREVDSMFSIFVFVRSPEGKMFPARLYYGPTRLALGRWDFKRIDNSKPAMEFEELVNFYPSKLLIEEKRELVIALELALMKLHKSEFMGILCHDFGYRVFRRNNDGGYAFSEFPEPINIEALLSFYGFEFKDNKIVKSIK